MKIVQLTLDLVDGKIEYTEILFRRNKGATLSKAPVKITFLHAILVKKRVHAFEGPNPY